MENKNWESFIDGEVIGFMQKNDLQHVMVDNGKNKAIIKTNSKGEINVTISVNKTL